MAEAERTEPNDPNAIALATVDASGLPNVRMVLLKAYDPRGFVFYTVFVAFVLMTLRALQNFVKDMTGRRSVREEAAESGPAGV